MSCRPSKRHTLLPLPGDRIIADRHLDRWQKLIDRTGMLERQTTLAGLGLTGSVTLDQLMLSIFGNSLFLTDAVFAEPDVLVDFLNNGPDHSLEGYLSELAQQVPVSRSGLMRDLRRVRRRIALLVALADITGVWSLEEVTSALSRFADRAVQQSLALSLAELKDQGDLELPVGPDPAARAGLVVLGMGKLGAFELNYSSDIDLIILFDPGRFRPAGKGTAMALAVRIARTLVYILEHRTKDGYVFRTDLRLRPHPPGHPLAISVEDAELYYERFGQNWERAALIKARVIAGDAEAGDRFLTNIGSFLWRRHLDYAAIRDIHAIKRQINRHRGHDCLRVLGHDLKVGRGGIREIEFFIQTQQLILGGRVPALRLRGSMETLDRLVETRWLDAGTAEDLRGAYEFFRTVEHRLQMVADKQTHQLPANSGDFAKIATFMGFAGAESFEGEVRRWLELVERHYAALFESGLDLGGNGALVFTGTDDDPATLKTLESLGFSKPADIAKVVRAWHHGHIRATRTARARELLTELMPELLRAFSDQADPDAAFQRFVQLMRSLPAGVQLFSLFRANPKLLSLVADLMGIAPRLADHLSKNVALFDAMLAPDFFEWPAAAAELEKEFDQVIGRARDLEDALDLARQWAKAREFQIGVQILLGQSDGARASVPLTAIAEIVIRGLLPRVEAWLASQHGRIDGGRFAVLGLGRLGSGELGIGSDLDLIFIFDAQEGARSDGDRSLPAGTYFARLGQRLVSALTARTAEGSLYEIDTRLRPSGNLGPVACSIESFKRYQHGNAQTWEHQALTRCRLVAGPRDLRNKVEAVVRETLTHRRDAACLAADVRAMRLRIFKEHGSEDPWNLKHARGGLVEAEFLAQYLQLRYGATYPGLLRPDTIGVFEQAAGTCISAEDSRLLGRAVRLYWRLQAVLRLSVDGKFSPERLPGGLRQALVRAASMDPEIAHPGLDINALGKTLSTLQQAVAMLFDHHCQPKK